MDAQANNGNLQETARRCASNCTLGVLQGGPAGDGDGPERAHVHEVRPQGFDVHPGHPGHPGPGGKPVSVAPALRECLCLCIKGGVGVRTSAHPNVTPVAARLGRV
eukprot:10559822-Alexandrium_andersonii.AAC.1